jgi:hypothetical protein
MYINTHPSCLIFVALVLTFVHSVTSQPVQASKWIKTNQYDDLNSRGTWKIFEKEGEIPLSDPSRHGSHVSISMNTITTYLMLAMKS